MRSFKERYVDAMEYSLNVCKNLKSGNVDIPDKDMAIIVKYEKLGLVKLTLPRVNLSKDIYYPTIQSNHFKGITQDSWVKIILWATKAYGIKCNLTIASANSYRTSPHRYNFIEPVVVKKQDVGTLLFNEEMEIFEEYSIKLLEDKA